MDLADRLRKILKDEYGIATDEQLLMALDEQTPVDIGIFVSPCRMGEKNEKAC